MADNQAKSKRQINGSFPKPPFWMISVALIGTCFAILVLCFALRGRMSKSELPRIHLILDMDNQIKYKTQHSNDIFADGRANRPKIAGTVAYGQLHEDDHYYRGYKTLDWDPNTKAYNVEFFKTFPANLTIDEKLLRRGQLKFNTYCMPCHGYDGNGMGPVQVRALRLAENPDNGMSTWVQPSNLTDETRRARVDGHIFNTITIGIRSMGGYGAALPDPADRWAIVAYVRALQYGQTLPKDAVPTDKLQAVTPGKQASSN